MHRNKKYIFIILVLILLLFTIDIILFLNRIKLWVYFNNKKYTLPISYSSNNTFYITAMVVNMEAIIDNYIEQMKKLIKYLGNENVIVSIVENGDSKDRTRDYLRYFQNYLNNEKVINKFLLNHDIDDPRKHNFRLKYSPLRIKFYAQLRNKCFDLLYEIPNLDFNKVTIIYFNDIFFEYEDIINLLATNNEDFDAACGMDFSDVFYDRWVSIDLSGNSFRKRFPYIMNKEGQDLIINHKPIRVFSCWNGVIVFKASPLKNKKVKFRYKNNNRIPKYRINNDQHVNFESECTYFHIDLFNLGYTKKFVNPDVRVTYNYAYYLQKKYYYPNVIDYKNYLNFYFNSFKGKRNKLMSNYKDRNIKLNTMLNNWYLENKINIK